MLVKLNRGSLPWEQARNQAEVQRIKEETPLHELCAHSPRSIYELLRRARRASFGDAVDYDALVGLFEPALRQATSHVRGDHSTDERKEPPSRAPSARAAPPTAAARHRRGRSRPRSEPQRAVKRSRSKSTTTAAKAARKKSPTRRRARARGRVRSTTPRVRRSKRLAAKPAVRYAL